MAVARRITPLAATPAPPPTPPRGRWQDNGRVVSLTEQLLELQRKSAARAVNAVVSMGRKMAQVRALLHHGQWEDWIASAVPFTSKTVTNYIMLANWADSRPADVDRLGHLGPTKLYLLAPLAPGHRRTLTTRKPQKIPGGGSKTIDVMTVAELGQVIGGFATPAGPRVPIAKVVQGVRHRIAGLDVATDVLIERRREVEADVAEGLRDRLVELVGELEGAFGI